MVTPPLGPLLWIVLFVVFRLFLGYRNTDMMLPPDPPPPEPDVELETLPDKPPELQSRIVRGRHWEQSHFMLSVEVRGRIPIDQAGPIRFSASVFDVESVQEGVEPVLRPAACLIERFQEPETARYHDELDVGVVNPGQGYTKWKPVVSIVPASLVPVYPEMRQYRVVVLAHDAEVTPTIERGFIHGDVVWAAAHDFSWAFAADDYHNFMFQHIASLEVVVHFAIAAGDPAGVSTGTCPTVEEWIDDHALRAGIAIAPDDRTRLTAALDTAWGTAVAGKSDLPRQSRRIRAICQRKDKMAALDLGLLLCAARHAPAAEFAPLESAAREIGIEPEVMAGLLARRNLRPIATGPPPT